MSGSNRQNQAQSKTLEVAFFPGTGLTYSGPGLVSDEDLVTNPIRDYRDEGRDDSFDLLGEQLQPEIDYAHVSSLDELNSKNTVYGYTGCHRRGGGVNAFGVEEPAEDLYQKLKRKYEHSAENEIKVVLSAHSRGCLSALLAAKKISQDENLKKKIKIVLDLKDPVPGNSRIAASLDVAGITTIAAQLKDLSNCECISEAHITVQEKSVIGPAFFDVLIPKFSPATKVHIEYMAGIHDIQAQNQNLSYTFPRSPNYHPFYTNAFYRHPGIHQLGIYKSLQIYLENGGHFKIDTLKNKLKKLHKILIEDEDEESINKRLEVHYRNCDRETMKNLFNTMIEAQKKCLTFLDHVNDAETALKFFKEIQVEIYDSLLRSYKENPKKLHLASRALHFGGEYKMLTDPDKATHFNSRHIDLQNQIGKPILKPVLFAGFSGNRLQLHETRNYDIKHFLSIKLNVDIDILFQNQSLAEIEKIVTTQMGQYTAGEDFKKMNPSEKEQFAYHLEFKRQFLEYKIRNAYQIYQWQMNIALNDENTTAKVDSEAHPKENHTHLFDEEKEIVKNKKSNRIIRTPKEIKVASDICITFIENIKKLIEDIPSWEIGLIGRLGLGFSAKTITINNNKILVPKHIAEIYKLSSALEIKKETNLSGTEREKIIEVFNEIAFIGVKASKEKVISLFGLEKVDPHAQKIYQAFKEAWVMREDIKEGVKSGENHH